MCPNIRVAIYHKESHPFVLNRRVIFDYEFLYLAKGTLLLNVEDRQYNVSSGDVIIIKPGMEHSFYSTSEETLEMPHMHLDLAYYDDFHDVYTSFKLIEQFSIQDHKLIRQDLLSLNDFNFPEHILFSDSKKILSLFVDIIKTHTEKKTFFEIKEKQLFMELFLEIYFNINNNVLTKINLKELKIIFDYIHNNMHRQITLKDITKQMYLSECYVERLFKAKYGQPIISYCRNRKMEKASELLLYSKLSISEIAQRVGYLSIHSFSKAFSKLYGLSPNNYKAKSWSRTTSKMTI